MPRGRASIKTYSSRQSRRISRDDTEPLQKKRRVSDNDENSDAEVDETHGPEGPRLGQRTSSSTTSSSPPPKASAIFSSDAVATEDDETPPSSPPQHAIPPPRKVRRPRGLMSRRKHTTTTTANALPNQVRSPLGGASGNATTTKPTPSRKKVRLTQMQIDLGGDVRKACKTCGMDYVPSNAEDAALHKKFHAINTGGVDFGKLLGTGRSGVRKVWESSRAGGEGAGFVMVVDRASPAAYKQRTRQVLEVVNTELSAVAINHERWTRVGGKTSAGNTSRDVPDHGNNSSAQTTLDKEDRFQVYLYIEGEKCIGLCLAESISEAFKVTKDESGPSLPVSAAAPSRSSSISVSRHADPALLGISRIWTSHSHRRKGIGITLLDCVRNSFIYAMQIPKDMVAFSQPTESGGRLAEKWFGATTGWHVYMER
ncbi:MAG: hypothetical protein M1819_006738 [Sarea resinae]|nr:MAG: hypothetical protein M1819_006738 [Sarea resinae]